jgi:hypothetical protein
MHNIELRNLSEARRYLLQGLWWQRVLPPTAATVRPALEWYLEMASAGQLLPPIGFVADIGQSAFGSNWELRSNRNTQALFLLPVNLVSTYEDHVLGKIYADRTFARASDALRQYQGRDRARGLAYLMGQFRDRAQFPGVEFSPGIIKNALDGDPAEVLAHGWESFQREGPLPLLQEMYEDIIKAARRMAEMLGPEDIFELEQRTALVSLDYRLAITQVLRVAAELEASIPRIRPRPPGWGPVVSTREWTDLPPGYLEEETYPSGGFQSLSNRGSIESLLPSQLAFMEPGALPPDLFEIMYALDGLLYYTRDTNQFYTHRRTFVLALLPDLVETRFKDAELPYQTGVMLMGLLCAAIRKLREWLSPDPLSFTLVFLSNEKDPRYWVLNNERTILEILLRDMIVRGEVTLQSAMSDQLQQACESLSSHGLIHCIVIGMEPMTLEARDTLVTRLAVNRSRPALGHGPGNVIPVESDDAIDAWALTLQALLRRWLWVRRQ